MKQFRYLVVLFWIAMILTALLLAYVKKIKGQEESGFWVKVITQEREVKPPSGDLWVRLKMPTDVHWIADSVYIMPKEE